MIDILVNSNKINTACKLFEEMRDFARRFGHGEGPAPEPTHAKARRVQKLKQVAIRKARAQGIHHLELDDAGLTEIAEEYANLVVADKPDDLIARPDVVTYTTVIKALGRMGDKSGAMQIFNMMRKDQVRLNEYAWTAIINAMCRTGDFKAGLRLLYEMKQTGVQPTKVTYRAMVVSAGRDGQVTLALALLQQMQTSGLQLEPVLMANLIRSLAEAGTVPDALRLHQQMAHGRFGPNMAPSRATYNALLESIADPHAWARMTLPPAALATGLAIYQEALLLGIFPHPYAERNENGVLDLRPYTRGAVLFPIHFCLNLLIDNIPINPSATQNLIKHADKIASRKFDVKAVADEFAVNSPFGASEGQTPMYFPRIPVPRKGIMLVSSKELRKSWSAAPKPLPYQSGFKLRKRQGEDFDPIMEPEPLPTAQRDYVEKVLRSTRPWIHYNVVPHNPNVVVVPSNTLRFWMHEQRKRAGYKDETENPRYPKVHHNQGIAHNRSPLLNSSSPINSILPQSNKLESSSDDQAEGDEPSTMAKSVTLGDTMMQKVRSKIQSSSSDAEDTARETDKLVNDVLHQQLEQPKPKKMPLKALASLKILSKKLMDTKKK
jgi:pentatricopeptide repeat protein